MKRYCCALCNVVGTFTPQCDVGRVLLCAYCRPLFWQLPKGKRDFLVRRRDALNRTRGEAAQAIIARGHLFT